MVYGIGEELWLERHAVESLVVCPTLAPGLEATSRVDLQSRRIRVEVHGYARLVSHKRCDLLEALVVLEHEVGVKAIGKRIQAILEVRALAQVVGRAFHGCDLPGGDEALTHGRVGVGVQAKAVAQHRSRGMAVEVPVGVTRQVDYRRFGDLRLKGELQTPVRVQGVGRPHVCCTGKALVTVATHEPERDAGPTIGIVLGVFGHVPQALSPHVRARVDVVLAVVIG